MALEPGHFLAPERLDVPDNLNQIQSRLSWTRISHLYRHMAAITDLTYDQLNAALGVDNAIYVGEDPLGNIGVLISVSLINGEVANTLSEKGTIKLLTRLMAACRKAQETLNEGQAAGEKLDAFPEAVSSGVVVDGYVQQTSAIKSRIAVATATEIVGPIA